MCIDVEEGCIEVVDVIDERAPLNGVISFVSPIPAGAGDFTDAVGSFLQNPGEGLWGVGIGVTTSQTYNGDVSLGDWLLDLDFLLGTGGGRCSCVTGAGFGEESVGECFALKGRGWWWVSEEFP